MNVLIRQLLGGDVQRSAAVLPRLKAEIASLVVERVPGHVENTVRNWVFKERPPRTRPVAVNQHEVGLRRSAARRLFFCTAENHKMCDMLICHRHFRRQQRHVQVVKEFWQEAASHIEPLLRIEWCLLLRTPQLIMLWFVDHSPGGNYSAEDYTPGDVNNADKTKVTTPYCRWRIW